MSTARHKRYTDPDTPPPFMSKLERPSNGPCCECGNPLVATHVKIGPPVPRTSYLPWEMLGPDGKYRPMTGSSTSTDFCMPMRYGFCDHCGEWRDP